MLRVEQNNHITPNSCVTWVIINRFEVKNKITGDISSKKRVSIDIKKIVQHKPKLNKI